MWIYRKRIKKYNKCIRCKDNKSKGKNDYYVWTQKLMQWRTIFSWFYSIVQRSFCLVQEGKCKYEPNLQKATCSLNSLKQSRTEQRQPIERATTATIFISSYVVAFRFFFFFSLCCCCCVSVRQWIIMQAQLWCNVVRYVNMRIEFPDTDFETLKHAWVAWNGMKSMCVYRICKSIQPVHVLLNEHFSGDHA